jgi:hypothetical protein
MEHRRPEGAYNTVHASAGKKCSVFTYCLLPLFFFSVGAHRWLLGVVLLSFSNVQAQGNSPVVTFDPPVHCPSITNFFHIILFDKKNDRSGMDFWSVDDTVPSRLCVEILSTTLPPPRAFLRENVVGSASW